MGKKDDLILFYEAEYYMFSNFASFAVKYGDRIWMTSEHAYQAAKFEEKDIIDLIHTSLSAHNSKKIAKEYKDKIKANWDEIKISVMEDIVRAKIATHPYIREKLLGTGDREIIEDSHQDSFWGRGADFKGRNELGKVWMKIRKELQNK